MTTIIPFPMKNYRPPDYPWNFTVAVSGQGVQSEVLAYAPDSYASPAERLRAYADMLNMAAADMRKLADDLE